MGVIYYQRYNSPAGELFIAEYCNSICICDWLSRKNRESVAHRISSYLNASFSEMSSTILTKAIIQLEEYFSGTRKEFDLPITMCGTEFQQKVWKSLQSIPYGQTISYKEQAALISNPKAIRAVAAANAANAISIILPCHRVVASDDTLTGYAGGIQIKEFLLRLEKHYAINR